MLLQLPTRCFSSYLIAVLNFVKMTHLNTVSTSCEAYYQKLTFIHPYHHALKRTKNKPHLRLQKTIFLFRKRLIVLKRWFSQILAWSHQLSQISPTTVWKIFNSLRHSKRYLRLVFHKYQFWKRKGRINFQTTIRIYRSHNATKLCLICGRGPVSQSKLGWQFHRGSILRKLHMCCRRRKLFDLRFKWEIIHSSLYWNVPWQAETWKVFFAITSLPLRNAVAPQRYSIIKDSAFSTGNINVNVHDAQKNTYSRGSLFHRTLISQLFISAYRATWAT